MTSEQIAAIRREYESDGLSEAELQADPYDQFLLWFDQAMVTEGENVNGMTLATTTPEGYPSARIVLLKGIDHGFLFYTNYRSRKGAELEMNPRAAIVFWWPTLNRQVRAEGIVERVSPENSDAYFESRPIGSRIGAAASPQSGVIESREALEKMVERVRAEHGEEGPIPRPEEWGGYRLIPESIEFWQGRSSRLHDRLHYRLADDHSWQIERLAP